MPAFVAQGPDGRRLLFSIAGDKPNEYEMEQINEIMGAGSAPQTQVQPGLLQSVGSGFMSGANKMQAAGDIVMSGLATALDRPDLSKKWDQYARAQQAEAESYPIKEGLMGSLAGSVGEMIPSLAAMGVTAASGVGIPVAMGIGAGVMAPNMLSDNAKRQYDQFGEIKDWRKLVAATGAQTGIEFASDLVTGKVAGVLLKTVPANVVKRAVDNGIGKAFTTLVRRYGEPTAAGMINGALEEISQQGFERWQAELPLLDSKAREEYIQAGIAGAILEGAFGGTLGGYNAYQEAKFDKAMEAAKADIDAEHAAGLRAADTNYSTYDNRRNQPYEDPPAPTTEAQAIMAEPIKDPARLLPNFAGPTREQKALEKEETKLPPGLADEAKPKVEEQFGPLFSETEYRQAVNNMRDAHGGRFGSALISTNLKFKKAKADAIFAEMLRRNDAYPSGSQNQYATITVPRGMPTREGSNVRGTTMPKVGQTVRSRDYMVKPVQPVGTKPFTITVNGKKKGKNLAFQTRAEAEAFVATMPENIRKNAAVEEDTSAYQFGIHEQSYEHMPNREQRLIGERVVNTFQTKAEADEALKGYDPQYSPETNKLNERMTDEEKTRRIAEDTAKEIGPVVPLLQKIANRLFGEGRGEIRLAPKLNKAYLQSQGINTDQIKDNTVIEGMSESLTPNAEKLMRSVITLNHDLTDPNLSTDQRAQKLAEVLNHEAIHTLRHLDLLTPQEWNSLINAAMNTKVNGKPYTYMQKSAVQHGKRGVEHTVEEAMADMFRQYINDPTAFRNPQRGLLKRLGDFIRSIMRLGRNHDAEDLMDTIFRGGVASRPTGFGGMGARVSPEVSTDGDPRAANPRNADDIFFSLHKSDNFYSHVERFVQGVQQLELPPQQWWKYIKNHGLDKAGTPSADELNWLGLKDWLNEELPNDNVRSLHKNDLLNYITASSPRIQTIIRANKPIGPMMPATIGKAQWSNMAIPGGGRHFEVAFTLQPKEGEPDFIPGTDHFVDANDNEVRNVLAFVRGHDWMDEDNKRVMIVDEMQSDLHQSAAKAGGYFSKNLATEIASIQQRIDNMQAQINTGAVKITDNGRRLASNLWSMDRNNAQLHQMRHEGGANIERKKASLIDHNEYLRKQNDELRSQIDAIRKDNLDLNTQIETAGQTQDKLKKRLKLPNLPFKTTWESYVINRLIRHAAENGYDSIIFHGTPESIAEVEGYRGVVEGVDEKGRTTYQIPREGRAPLNLTPIYNRYLIKIPDIVKPLAQRFGAQFSNVPIQIGARKNEAMDWMSTDPREYAQIYDVESLQAHFPTKRSLIKAAADLRIKHNLENWNNFPAQQKADADIVLGAFEEAVQMAHQQRRFDAADAFGVDNSAASGNGYDIVNLGINWLDSNWANVAGFTEKKRVYNRLDLSYQMQDAYRKGDVPKFSALEAADRSTVLNDPNFQRWFSGSVVTNDDGTPKVVYHGTKADKNFSRFNKLSHFGTTAAAQTRMENNRGGYAEIGKLIGRAMDIPENQIAEWWKNLPYEEYAKLTSRYNDKLDELRMARARVYPVYLNLRRPLAIKDDNSNHNAFSYGMEMLDKGILTEKRFREIMALRTDEVNNYTEPGEQAALGEIVKELEAAGYDGFQYVNRGEDAGSTSYVALRPNQIKSVFNRGTWAAEDPDIMYSALEERGAELNKGNADFRKWFYGSAVADADGNPKLVFTGTSADRDFDRFRAGKRGIWFTEDPVDASSYATSNDSQKIVRDEASSDPWATKRINTAGRVIPAFLAIKKPYTMTSQDMERMRNARGYMKWQADFFDVIKSRPEKYDGVKWGDGTWVAFSPDQVKGALNKEFSAETDKWKFSALEGAAEPKYMATAPLGQRVPLNPPLDSLSQIHNNITYDNIAPVFHKLFGKFGITKAAPVVDDTIIALQDKMLSVGRMVDRMKKKGGFISDENDPYLRQTLYPGQVDAALVQNHRDFYTPLTDAVKHLDVTARDIDALRALNPATQDLVRHYIDNTGADAKLTMAEIYLYAQHAQERNAVMRKRNERAFQRSGARLDQWEAGSGMRDEDAVEILDWINRQRFGAKLNSLTDINSVRMRMRALIKSTNDIRVAGGLNPDFRTMAYPDGTPVDSYRDYVPLRGFINEAQVRDDMTGEFARTGKGFNVRGKEDFTALGRDDFAANLMATSVLQNQEAIVRSGKNKVSQSFYRLIEQDPQEFAAQAEIMQTPKTKWAFDRRIGSVRQIIDNTMLNDPTVLKVKIDGQQKFIKLHDPKLVRAMNATTGLGTTGLNTVLNGLLKVNRGLAAMRTSFSPEFVITNMLRDLGAAMTNISEYEAAGLRKAVISSVFPAMKGVYQFDKTGDANTEWAKTYKEFKSRGGHSAWLGTRELVDTINHINTEMGEDFSGAPQKVWKGIRSIGEFLSRYNNAVENSTRLAAYKAMRDFYLSKSGNPTDPNNIRRAQEMAAFAAKNLTVNFNAGGEAKPVMNALYLFFNANIQGSAALLNPLIRSPRIRRMWAGIAIAGVVQDLMMSMLSGEDDDGQKIYDKIPDYILEHNIVLMDPFGLSERGYFKIPMPYLLNSIYNWGRSISRGARGGYTFGEVLKSGGMGMVDSLNPWGGTNSLLNFVAPSMVDPIVDLYQNEDWTGKPIAPQDNPFGLNEAKSQRYWNNTNPVFVSISDWMSRLTGRQGDFIPGVMEWSPNQVEYVWDFMLGGVGTFLSRGLGLAGRASGLVTGEEDLSSGDIPFVRKIFGTVTKREDMQSYIEGRDDVLKVRQELKDAIKDGDSERYTRIMRLFPDKYRASVTINKIENARRKLASNIKRIRESTRITDDRKEELIKQLKDRQELLVASGNKVLQEMRQR